MTGVLSHLHQVKTIFLQRMSSKLSISVRDLPAFENEDDLIGMGGDQADDDDEGDGENLFGDDMEADYRANPELDRFDPNLLDEEEYEALSEGERRAAEASMRKRDREEGRNDGRRGMGRTLIYDDEDEEEGPRRQRRRMAEMAAMEEDVADDPEALESIENLEDTKGKPIREHVAQLGIRKEIMNRFRNFMRTYTNEKGEAIFQMKIKDMCLKNRSSFEVKPRTCNVVYLVLLMCNNTCY